MYNDELYHYGVLGMKWGVRRTPEQLGHHKIPTGTVMYRTTANKNESTKGHKYVTYLPPDRDLYRGGWADSIRAYAGKDSSYTLHEKKYTLKEDLKIPSRKEVDEVASKLIKDKKANIEVGKAFFQNFVGSNPYMLDYIIGDYLDSGKIKTKYTKGYSNKSDALYDDNIPYKEIVKLRKETGKIFVDEYVKNIKDQPIDVYSMNVEDGLGGSDYLKSKVIGELQKRGYNAMVDEASVGGRNGREREGVEPLIIFDGDKSLIDEGSHKINRFEEQKATKEYTKWKKVANSSGHKKNPW